MDNFVDMRLKLPAPEDRIGEAARALTLELPEPEVPFGEGPEFTVERAAQVAADLAGPSGLTMRQIERVLLRVRLALVTYRGTPVDVALLVWLAFDSQVPKWAQPPGPFLPRSELHSGVATRWKGRDFANLGAEGQIQFEQEQFVEEIGTFMIDVAKTKHRLGPPPDRHSWKECHLVIAGLAPWYIPEHQAMLDQVHHLAAD